MSFLELPYRYWDIAGVDGLAVAQSLGPVERLAPFQSLETEVAGQPCSVLRLCEGNFRIGWAGESSELETLLAVQNRRCWIKQFDWLGTLVLPASVELDWASLAIPKPPHRLVGLANHCAAPARIDGLALLFWRHPVLGQPVIELQMAQPHQDQIKQRLLAALNLAIPPVEPDATHSVRSSIRC